MEKLGRDERSARKALASAFDQGFKSAAKARNWSYLKPTPFVRVGDWFVTMMPSISTEARRATLGITAKPFLLDDLVSRIMLQGGLDGTPLSLRARGPHCLVRPAFTGSIEADTAEAMLTAAIAFADTTIERVASLSLEDFIEFAREDGPPGQVSVNCVAALLLADRHEEAAALCEGAIAAKQWGGPARMTDDGRMVGFFELARHWIAER